MKKNNYLDAIELREILKINQALLSDIFDESNYNKNLELISCDTDDQYLNDRGVKFKEAIKVDEELKNLIGRLDYKRIKDTYILKYFNSWCMEKRSNDSSKFNFIDLFCGAGGLSLGFLQEGFNVNFACDIEEACVETYRFNHPNVPSKNIVNEDIKNIENNISEFLRFNIIEKNGITIILITHYMDEAAQAKRVVVVDDGKIIIDDVPKKVFSQVELLKSRGLDVPQVTELSYRLRQDGIDIGSEIINEDECVSALLGLLKK